MRRFEFAEGTSSKFWQVALDGSSLTVVYGRIGTAGTSQRKELADEAAALREHDKLIGEKTKKGYVEVTGATAASPTPAAAPAKPAKPAKAAALEPVATAPPTATAPIVTPPVVTAPIVTPPVVTAPSAAAVVADADERIVWTAAQVATVAPHRGGPIDPASKPPTVAGAIAALTAAYTEWKHELRRLWSGKPKSAADQPLFDAAWAFLEAPNEALDLETQRVVGVLFGVGSRSKWRFGPLTPRMELAYAGQEALLDLWFLAGGPAFSVKAMDGLSGFQSFDLQDVNPHSQGGARLTRQEVDRETSASGLNALHLAARLAGASEEAYAAGRAAAAELWPTVGHGRKQGLLRLFPMETAWADEVAEEWFENIETWMKMRFVFPEWEVRYSLDVLTRLAKACIESYGLARSLVKQAGATWLSFYGTEVLPLLIWGIDATEWEYDRKVVVGLVGAVEGARSAKALAACLADRQVREDAQAWLEAHPALAVPPLSALVAGRGRLADPAGAILTRIDRAHVGLLDARMPTLPGGSQRAIAALRDLLRPPPDCAASEVPAVLADPPWRKKVKKKAPSVVTGLDAAARPEAIHWARREREQLLKDIATYRRPTTLAELTAALAKKDSGHSALYFMTGLSDAEALAAWNTLPGSVYAYTAQVAGQPLARHGLDAVSGYLKTYAAAQPLATAVQLARVDSVRVASFFAHAFGGKSLRRYAEAWMGAFPETAAYGLVPIAVGPEGKERQSAEAALRWLAGKGKQEALVHTVAANYGPEAAAAASAVLEADPRDLFPSKPPKLPAFWDASSLVRPRLRGRERALPLAAVDALAEMLAFSAPDAPYAGLEDVREACDPESLEAFAWSLFNTWNLAGGPSKEGWAFQAVAVFGGDESARRLTPLIRAWPGEAAQARAVVGLDVLAKIGTDVALMHLNGIAEKIRFKALQERAKEKVAEVAADRGLTTEDLADRLVPDLDLEEDGSRTLDFGPRQFTIHFDEELKPLLRGADGKVLPDLPKPVKTDDAALAKAAAEAWKTLKKDAKAVSATQITRLELAMCRQRRWEVAGFKTFLVDHPLVIHLVRRLVWGLYVEGRLVSTFRVAEDRTLANAEDAAYSLPSSSLPSSSLPSSSLPSSSLPSDGQVGIVHALDLDAARSAAWGQIFADYAILQPFPQLGRDTYTPTAAEAKGATLARVDGVKIKSKKLLGLDVRGWRRGGPQDSGGVWSYDKPLGAWTVELGLTPGLAAEWSYTEEDNTLCSATLVSNDPDEKPTFAALPPIVFSELVRDMLALRG